MKIKFSDIPEDKNIEDYPDDTTFVLDDRPYKIDPETFERVLPNDVRYDNLPFINFSTGEFIK